MKYMYYLGVDVGKESLWFSLRNNYEEQFNGEVENNSASIKKFIKQALLKEGVELDKTLVCLEHTGVYSYHVIATFYELASNVWVENAISIKRSLGLQRGKNDKVDASRIAEYAFRFNDRAKLWKPRRNEVELIRKLYTIRFKLIHTRKQLNMSEKQPLGYESNTNSKMCKSYYKPVLTQINKQIEQVTQRIRDIIKADPNIKQLTEIVTSVTGIGEVIAWKIIILTNEFKDFSDGRKFACYSGVVPFEHLSGTSIKGKSRVSFMANKEMKALLHLGALSAISREKGELFDYYQRKVQEGKSKMLVVNAVRNKLVQRIFACVRDNQKYKDFKLA